MTCGTMVSSTVTRRVKVPARGSKEKATFPSGQYKSSFRTGFGISGVCCGSIGGDEDNDDFDDDGTAAA